MKMLVYLILPISIISSCSDSSNNDVNYIEGQTEDGFEDGKYCAEVEYNNPNTEANSTYTLEVEVESNTVTTIYWNNGGWLDEDHFSADELDSEGTCSFTSDKGYEYTVTITGKNCSNLDSEDEIKSNNLPMYSFEEVAYMLFMTQEEIEEFNEYEDDVLSINHFFLLKRSLNISREHNERMKAIDNMFDEQNTSIYEIEQLQRKLQNEVKEGYIENITSGTAFGLTSQVMIIKKRGIRYLLEIRGNSKCTMGTARFDENASGWQMVYIKQYPNVEKLSGHSMRIIDSGF
jgi:hypothetical protein